MKKKAYSLLFVVGVLWFPLNAIVAQSTTLSDPIVTWQRKLKGLEAEFKVKQDKEKLEADGTEKVKLTSNPVLNVFFKNQINSYLSESGDVATSKGYAVLDNSDGRLFLGGAIALQKNKTEKLSHILNAGIKTNIKDNFATLIDKEGDFQNDMGFSLKYTFVGNGTIVMKKSGIKKLNNRRAYFLEQLEQSVNDELEKVVKANNKIKTLTADEKQKEAEDIYKEKYNELKVATAEQEAEYIESKSLYSWARTTWVSFEAYVPVTKSKYNVGAAITSKDFEDETYRPFEATLSGGILLGAPKFKAYGRLYMTVYQNNSIEAEQIKKSSFEQTVAQGASGDTTFIANIKQDDVYIGEFNEFITTRMGGEISIFPGQEYVGFSFRLERFFGGGDFEGTNWTLGLPVSLKGKKDDAKVNFELQYRKLNGDKSFGLSVGVPFGSVIYK